MKRTEQLKQTAYENGKNPNRWAELDHLQSLAYTQICSENFHNLRRAKMDCFILDRYTIEVTPGELLVGRFSLGFAPTAAQKAETEQGQAAMRLGGPTSGHQTGGTGHRALDYEKLLGIGVRGILEEIDDKLKAIDYTDPEDAQRQVFYEASKLSLQGFCRFAARVRQVLLELAARAEDSVQRAEYERMAENLARAPYEPCGSFYEALQCQWLLQFVTHLLRDTALSGRPDQYLYPYYVRDIESGAMTREFALELIENYYLKHNEIYANWPAALLVGGVDRDGLPVWNDLTRMFLEAVRTTGLVNPSVAVAYTPDMPEDILALCVELVAEGYTRPSLFNDAVVQRGLVAAGVAPRDARYYMHSTCVEITPVASSNIVVARPYINPTKALEYILGGGKALFGDDCGLDRPVPLDQDRLGTYRGFVDTLKAVLAEIIRTAAVGDCMVALERQRYQSCPLSSAFIDDCIEKGQDTAAGGARYHFFYPCFPGFVTMVDSVAAIKKAVYEEHLVSLEEMAELCYTDFSGQERTRQYLVNRCEKFGNGQQGADEIATEFYDFLRDELARYHHCIGFADTFHPSYFAWIQHGELGRRAAATPNGRRQGEALSEHLGASQGMDRNTPLGVVQSIAKLKQEYGIGGIATNFRFGANFMKSEDGKNAVLEFIRYFMEMDCFEAQFNVVDQTTLLDAKAHPEQYATLMVRVAGYSDYFTSLAPEIQEEIIKRTEHAAI